MTSSKESEPEEGGGELDARFLRLLVCPVARTPLVYDKERGELISKEANLAYPIRDGIPIMLPEEARTLDEEAALPGARGEGSRLP